MIWLNCYRRKSTDDRDDYIKYEKISCLAKPHDSHLAVFLKGYVGENRI